MVMVQYEVLPKTPMNKQDYRKGDIAKEKGEKKKKKVKSKKRKQ